MNKKLSVIFMTHRSEPEQMVSEFLLLLYSFGTCGMPLIESFRIFWLSMAGSLRNPILEDRQLRICLTNIHFRSYIVREPERESNLKLQNIHICVCRITYAVSPTSHPPRTTATPTTIPTLPHTPGGEKDLTAQTEIFTKLFSRYYEGPPPTYRGREESRSR